MKIPQHITDLLRPFHHTFLRLGSFRFQPVVKCPALDIVHNDQKCVVTVNYVYDTWQMRMVETLKDICLRYKPLLHDLIVFRAVFPDLLDRPLLVGSLIHGQIDNTHSSLSDLVQDFIFTIYYRSYFKHISIL